MNQNSNGHAWIQTIAAIIAILGFFGILTWTDIISIELNSPTNNRNNVDSLIDQNSNSDSQKNQSPPNSICPLIVKEGTISGLPITQTTTWSELTAQGTTRESQTADLSQTCSRDPDNQVQVFVGYWSDDPKYLNFYGSMTPNEAISLARNNPNEPVIIVPWGE